MSACTITQPIPEPAGSNFFSALPAATAASAVYVKVQPGTNLCVAIPTLPSCFADGLGEAIEATDRQRLHYLNLAREVSNGNAAYNALLYPLGAAAVFELVRGASNPQLRLPALAAGALYGFINSGVPEREKHYLRASAALQCAVLRQSEWLYRRSEIEIDESAASARSAPLETLTERLREEVDGFSSSRLDLLIKLKAPAAGAGPAGAIERRKSGGAKATSKDARADVIQQTQDQLQLARQMLVALDGLRVSIGGAAWRLAQDTQSLGMSIQSGLSEKVLPPKDPAIVAKALKDALAVAQAGDASALTMDPVMPAGKLKSMDKTSSDAVLQFGKDHGVPLEKTWSRARRFLTAHLLRNEQAAADRQAFGCGERLPALPSPVVALPPASAASAAGKGDSVETTPL